MQADAGVETGAVGSVLDALQLAAGGDGFALVLEEQGLVGSGRSVSSSMDNGKPV